MISLIRHYFAERHRRRIEEAAQDPARGTDAFVRFKRALPHRCMYCAYTRWVNTHHGMHLPLEAHTCIEGKCPLPKAKVVS